jgi:hypothetical protein
MAKTNNSAEQAIGERPWRERIELGVAIVDELEPNWIAIEGKDFVERMELVLSLTDELSTDWLAILCYCGNADRPVSRAEISGDLKLDPDEVSRCLTRLGTAGLVCELAGSGAYVLATRGLGGAGRANHEVRRITS